MLSVKPNLLYITSQYPQNTGDAAFIKTEIKYLSAGFNKITVLSHGKQKDFVQAIPQNVEAVFFRNDSRIIRLPFYGTALFHKTFWKEISYLVRGKKLSLKTLKTALSFYASALYESRQIKNIIKKKQIDICYTFWYWNSTFACLIALKNMGLTYMSCGTHSIISHLKSKWIRTYQKFFL